MRSRWGPPLRHGDSVSRCPCCHEGQRTFAYTYDSETCALCGAGLESTLAIHRERFIESKIKELLATVEAYKGLLEINSPLRTMLLPAMKGIIQSMAALEAIPNDKIPAPPQSDDAVRTILD